MTDEEFKCMVIERYGLSYWYHLEGCVDNAVDGYEDDCLSDYAGPE